MNKEKVHEAIFSVDFLHAFEAFLVAFVYAAASAEDLGCEEEGGARQGGLFGCLPHLFLIPVELGAVDVAVSALQSC